MTKIQKIKEIEDKISDIRIELENTNLSDIEIKYLKVKKNSLFGSLRHYKKVK